MYGHLIARDCAELAAQTLQSLLSLLVTKPTWSHDVALASTNWTRIHCLIRSPTLLKDYFITESNFRLFRTLRLGLFQYQPSSSSSQLPRYRRCKMDVYMKILH